MADKILYSDIISPEVQAQLDLLADTIRKLTEELGQLRKATEKEQSTSVEYNDTLRDSVELTDDLLRLIKDEIVLKKEVEKAQLKLKNTEKLSYEERNKLNAAVLKGKENLRAHGFVLRNAIKLNNSVKTSMTELSLELANNRMAYRKLSEEQRNNSKVGKVLLKTIQRQDAAIKKLDKEIGNHQRNVGNYTSIVSGLSSTMSGLSPNIYKVSAAFRVYVSTMKLAKVSMAGMSKSAKLLRIALISTGIGAIVVALGTLVGMLMQSSKFTDWFAEKMAYLGGVFDYILTVLGILGDALVLFFQGKWDEAADVAAGAFKNLGDEMGRAGDAAVKLRQDLKDLDDQVRINNIKIAILNGKIAEYKRLIKGENLINAEKLALAKKIKDAQLESLKIRQDEITKTLQSTHATEENGDEINALQVEYKELDDAIKLLMKTPLTDYFKLNEAAAASYMHIVKNLKNDINKLADEDIDIDKAEFNVDEELANEIELYKLLQTMRLEDNSAAYNAWQTRLEKIGELESIGLMTYQQYLDEKARADGKYNAYVTKLEADAMATNLGNVSAIIGGLGQVGKAMGATAEQMKAIQIAQAVINTFAAANQVLATEPGEYIIKAIAVAATIATGLANVATIVAQPIPEFAEGTDFLTGEKGKDKIPIMADYGERIVPSYINSHLTGIKNIELPGIIKMGLSNTHLQAMVEGQKVTNSLLGRMAYVDGKGTVHYLSGDTKYYV